jgi:hypothetical protein
MVCKDRDFLRHRIQIDSAVHPAIYLVGTLEIKRPEREEANYLCLMLEVKNVWRCTSVSSCIFVMCLIKKKNNIPIDLPSFKLRRSKGWVDAYPFRSILQRSEVDLADISPLSWAQSPRGLRYVLALSVRTGDGFKSH